MLYFVICKVALNPTLLQTGGAEFSFQACPVSQRNQRSGHGNVIQATTRRVLSWWVALLNPTATGLHFILFLTHFASLSPSHTHMHTQSNQPFYFFLFYFSQGAWCPCMGSVYRMLSVSVPAPHPSLSGFLRNAGTGWRSSKGGVTRKRVRQA